MYPDDRKEIFGDFSLKLLGELVSEDVEAQEREGHWVASCSAFVRGNLETRTVVLSAGAFDTRQRFLEQLRKRFGNGTFNLTGLVVANHLADYYSSLKEDATSTTESRVFFHSNHLGFQNENYWMLSSDLHIKQGIILPPSQYQCFVLDNALSSFGTSLDGRLLEVSYLKSVTKRFLELSSHFGTNAIAFQLATSFVIWSLIKAVLTKSGADFSDESCIGVVYSTERNIGKSLTLQLLSKGQGVDNRSHPLLCSGGDQNLSGTSLKVMMYALQSTTLTCFVDDPVLTSPLSEFLLQIQSGLPQGSMKSGRTTPKGSVLISTNSSECSRVHGRILRLDYAKDPNFSRESEAILENDLNQLVTLNKGFLVAWVILFMPKWLNSTQHKSALVEKLRAVLKKLAPEQQPRWHKGAAQLIYTFVVLHQTAGLEPKVSDALELVTSSELKRKHQEHSFWQRLEEELLEKLNSPRPVLTWLNPTVNVSVGGNFVPAIAITSREMGTFTSLKNTEIREEIQKVTDPQRTKTSTSLFAIDGTATVQDVRKKTDKSRNSKGFKIPKTCFSSKVIVQIELACGMRDTLEFEPAEEAQRDNHPGTHQEPLNEDIMRDIMTCVENLKEFDKENRESDDDRPLPHTSSDSGEDMSPMSKLQYSTLTPKRKKVFQAGLRTGRRIEKRKMQQQTLPGDNVIQPNHPEDVTPSTTIEEPVTTCARRILFEHDVNDGSVGVLKRKQRTHQTESAVDKSVCGKCKEEVPPKARNSGKRKSKDRIVWVQCDECHWWYHLFCTNLESPPSTEAWFCNSCNTVNTRI